MPVHKNKENIAGHIPNNIKVNKVLIIGIDALEYDLVEKWDLKNLKQLEHGKTVLPIYEDYIYDEPATTIMWPSFITGKNPSEHGIKTVKVWDLRILTWIARRRYIKFRNKGRKHSVDIGGDSGGKAKEMKRMRRILDRLGIEERYPEKKDLRSDTLFDIPLRTIALHVPGYNKPTEAFPSCKDRIMDALEKKGMYRAKWEMECRRSWKEREKELFTYLKYSQGWDLLMQYFFTLDAIQHSFPEKMNVIKEWYLMADRMLEKVHEKIPDNTLVLVVSDHGQKKGIHTMHGFYSSNISLGLKNPRLIDFRWIIEDIFERQNIKE